MTTAVLATGILVFMVMVSVTALCVLAASLGGLIGAVGGAIRHYRRV